MLLQKYQDFSDNQIIKLSLDKIKGILFKVYSTINNKEAYNKINCWSLQYKTKLNKGILEEGYIIQEKIIELQDKYLFRKDESNVDEEDSSYEYF